VAAGTVVVGNPARRVGLVSDLRDASGPVYGEES
jgi:hypothetical protein